MLIATCVFENGIATGQSKTLRTGFLHTCEKMTRQRTGGEE